MSTHTRTDLLPCPFCGCTEVQLKAGSTYRWAAMACVNCGAQCGEVRGHPADAQTAEIAIVEWNKRAAASPKSFLPGEPPHCSTCSCGASVEPDGYSVGLHENPPDRSAEVFASISRELPTLYDEPTKPEYDDTGDLCVVKGCTGLACKGSFVCWDHRVKPENRSEKPA